MSEAKTSINFIEQIIQDDLSNGYSPHLLRFRFPPEPNGYLHIGHAKAICLNFGLGESFNAPVNLRFDDTNPTKEEQAFIDAIEQDVKWLGFPVDKICYTSDYFQQLYDWAVLLIQKGLAYVDDQSSELINKQRKTPFEHGVDSPFRSRSIEENLDLFESMRTGKYSEGEKVLRAKIDMTAPNMNMRDPIMYRILKQPHHRTGDQWHIYPLYDWAHGQSDYIEGISHSLCSMEFENHRPLYEWYLSHLPEKGLKPKQREFSRLNLNYTITSKRKLQQLVQEGVVLGWDDPRMPTIAGLHRRGYTSKSIRTFCQKAGVSKRDNQIDVALLEFSIREDLNQTAQRVMAVQKPIKLVITNYPDDQVEWLETENNLELVDAGSRTLPFSKNLFIEQDDFMEEASKKYFRLAIGQEVRLKSAYIINAHSVDKDELENTVTVYATYDPLSKSGSGTEESHRKVKGTIHWLSQSHAIAATFRLYDRLFLDEHPDQTKGGDFMSHINPNSLETINGYVEPSLQNTQPQNRYQFQRIGYYCTDTDSSENQLIFNRIVTLKDTWQKINKTP